MGMAWGWHAGPKLHLNSGLMSQARPPPQDTPCSHAKCNPAAHAPCTHIRGGALDLQVLEPAIELGLGLGLGLGIVG